MGVSQYLAAEIKGAFDDLKREGSIKLTQVGEDEKLDALITTAYNKITEMMFSPMGGTGGPDLASLTGSGGQPSMLDRATSYLRQNQQDARAENERSRREPADSRGEAAGTPSATAARPPRRRREAAGARSPWPSRRTPGRRQRFHGRRPSARLSPASSLAGAHLRRPGAPHRHAAHPAGRRARRGSVPSFAVLASFEMKSVRQRGIFKIDLNKYTTDNLTLRFDENVGDMRSLMKEGEHFRQVNLDDPLYKQRELVVFVDGMNAKDFGDYINFATVQMRKKHQAGRRRRTRCGSTGRTSARRGTRSSCCTGGRTTRTGGSG